MMLTKLVLSAAAFTLVTGGLGADDAKNKEETKFDKVMARYERSGEMKNCVSPSRLNQSQILDNKHILFKVSPRRGYLNTLPRECRPLKFHDTIKYTVRGGQLCSNDIFQVLDQDLRTFSSCSFGKFEKVERISSDKDDKKQGAASE